MNLSGRRGFKTLYDLWMKFARILGRIQTTIILFFIYFFGIGLIAVIAFIFRKDFLDKGPARDRESFWKPRAAQKPDLENAKRQF